MTASVTARGRMRQRRTDSQLRTTFNQFFRVEISGWRSEDGKRIAYLTFFGLSHCVDLEVPAEALADVLKEVQA